jgi:hypothetical protein
MTISALAGRVSALILLTLLPACQTANSSGTPTGEAAEPVRLPADFRQKIAPYLVPEYVTDGVGPATISEVETYQGPLGGGAAVLIRYPVKGRNYAWFPDRTSTRCIRVEAARGIATGGQDKFSVTRSRNDGEGCSGFEKSVPYVELERMASRLQACKASGEERCLLSTNMPEAQARKLMNMR